MTDECIEHPVRVAPRPASPVERILHRHHEGLARFATVIDGNPNYDALLAHRLKREQLAEFPDDLCLRDRHIRAIALAEKAVRQLSIGLLRPAWPGIVCDGRTRNNIREFEFFEHICAPIGLKILPFNYATAEKVPAAEPNQAQQDALEHVIGEIRAFYQARTRITASLVHQQILYSKTFFKYLLSFTAKGAVLPSALVQANDHSPSRVALSMVMKGLGVPRIYVQHAEVSKHFPPLDFEYSVLRNRRSLAIYEAIGPVAGQVFVIGRHTTMPRLDSLAERREGTVRVVIYPTSRVNVDALREIIARLRRNDAISEVMLKPHPGAARPLNEALEGTEVVLIDSFPEDDHIAIVGNSSVVIELLAKGIPVYQNFEFDPIDRDYYGFVRAGIALEAPTSDLNGAFWKPYVVDENWRKAFTEWVPIQVTDKRDEVEFVAAMARLALPVEGTPSETQSGASAAPLIAPASRGIRAATRRLVRSTISKAARRVERLGRSLSAFAQPTDRSLAGDIDRPDPTPFVAYTLGQVQNPARWIALNEQDNVFPPVVVMKAIETLQRHRDPALQRIFEEFPSCPTGSVVGSWIYLKRSMSTNIEITAQELERILDLVGGEVTNLRRRLQTAIFPAVIKYGTLEQLDRLIGPGSSLAWDQLSFNRRLQVISRIRAYPGREDEAERLLQDLLRRASELEKLKIRAIDYFEGRTPEGWSHRFAEEMFAKAAPAPIGEEFRLHVRPVYDALRTRMGLMDVRSDPFQRDAFLDRIRNAIMKGSAFSCIRMSDREGYLFPEKGYFGATDIGNCERHWWGTELEPNLRSQIVDEARKAIANADVVGIPSVYRFIRDVSDQSTSLFSTLQGRGLVNVLHGTHEYTSEAAIFSEDKFNVGLFRDPGIVRAIASLAERTVVVSSVRPEHMATELRDIRTDHVALPTHNKTRLNPRYVCGGEPLPLIYPDLVERMETLVGPRTLVLVAGGLVGKIFVGRARARGAVVLDMGHVIDDWINPRRPAIR